MKRFCFKGILSSTTVSRLRYGGQGVGALSPCNLNQISTQDPPLINQCVRSLFFRASPALACSAQVVLFLDYDGTLSPIVDQPEKAFMKDGMRPVLAEVTPCFNQDDHVAEGGCCAA